MAVYPIFIEIGVMSLTGASARGAGAARRSAAAAGEGEREARCGENYRERFTHGFPLCDWGGDGDGGAAGWDEGVASWPQVCRGSMGQFDPDQKVKRFSRKATPRVRAIATIAITATVAMASSMRKLEVLSWTM